MKEDLAASSPCPGAVGDGSAQWDEWHRRFERSFASLGFAGQLSETVPGLMRVAFLAGWAARDGVERRKAADELTTLTEELGLYDEGGRP